ncbi:MAG: ATP-binding protein [Pseudomonadota bacterium]|jgi:two-component system sensor histidine kinase PilS (NtrC family)
MAASSRSLAPTSVSERRDSVWVSFGYFSLYRLIVATVFFLSVLLLGRTINLGSEHPVLFAWVGLVYWLLAIFFYAGLRKLRLDLNLQLTLQVVCDITALTLMMHASGGPKSGLAIMLLIVLAGAGLVGQGRLVVLYAALASVSVLAEQAYRNLAADGDLSDFFQSGIISAGFFATAISARLLAQRIIYNEELARSRGIDLMNQFAINQRVIRDMQDGVLVAARDGKVRQFNPQVEALLGVQAPSLPDVGAFSAALAERHARVVTLGREEVFLLRAPGSGKTLRVRLVPTRQEGDVLIYLEDLERVQKQAQQFKLAALGRLTANMAHEIRNPLSAISHAAELLREERRADTQARLARIIIDNSQRLERLVKDVLELGRRVKAEPEVIKLGQFLEAFTEEFTAREGIDRAICAIDAPADAVIWFDRVHLNQVLWNLVTNALRYCSRRAGSIRLSVHVFPEADGTELHVVDDGPGVPPGSRGQVFEPFFTTHSKGTGLGLYIARELCEANQAVLELLENGPGAHFRVAGRSEGWDDRIEEAAVL